MPGSLFPTTRRSVVLALASDDEAERTRAYDTLAAIYWKPLYKYVRSVHERAAADAEDLIQAFLTHTFARNALASYDPGKASFRTFLRTLIDRHAANEQRSASRLKRGGAQIHLDLDDAEAELASEKRSGNPEHYFRDEWVRSVFALALDRLRESIDATPFAVFTAYDIDASAGSYRELGQRFGISESAVTNALAAARRKFRESVLDLLREITASDREFREEARSLLGVDV